MRLVLLVFVLFLSFGCHTSAGISVQQTKVARKPLNRIAVKLGGPANYDKSDSDDGKPYDHKPRVVVIDERAGKYEFRWIGSDKKEKIIKYQRNGAIDVLVSANVLKNENGKYLYIYRVENLSSSANRLSGFTVQNFASEAKPLEFDFDNSYIGAMSDIIPRFTEGKWLRYGILLTHKPVIAPGLKIELQLESPALPGVVECKADGGEFGTIGVGEEMPPELERLALGTKDWPYGYTIGPVDKLAEMNKSERSKYIRENLPKFQEAGWMSSGTAEIYKSILEREDLAGAFKQAKKDLDKEFITSEVYHIIEGLNQ